MLNKGISDLEFRTHLLLIRKHLAVIEKSKFALAFGMSGFAVRDMRESGRLLMAIEEFIPFHEGQCGEGANCFAYFFPDAAIFIAVCQLWEIALYEQSDRKDAKLFRRDMKNWKAYRAVIENGE
jgi:hypothetical protein